MENNFKELKAELAAKNARIISQFEQEEANFNAQIVEFSKKYAGVDVESGKPKRELDEICKTHLRNKFAIQDELDKVEAEIQKLDNMRYTD